MPDKQLIIEACNVSECKYFNGYQRIVRNNECIVDMQNACIEEIKTKPCSQKHNCYFKNWQRKEQECERLKHKIFRYEELFKHSAMAQNTYTAEEVNTIASGIKFVGNSLTAEENNKLHKTLTEIKEIAITGVEGFCPKCSRKECEDNNCIETAIRDILQKISEVEDESNN